MMQKVGLRWLNVGNKTQRRRLQIRTAQRAYRSRKENEVSQLVDHAARLESTISDLTNVFTTFTDWLISSGELTAHADIAKRTFETVEKARDLAKIVKVSDVNANSSMVRPPPRTLTAATRKPLPPNLQGEPIKPQPHIKHALYPSCSPPNQGHVDMTRFMDHLHWAILSRGTALLSDLAVPMQALNSHFCLMLAVTTRASLASHFDAALHAKLSLQPKHDKWRSVPFFPLGGAGTHYSWSTSCGQYSRRSRQWQWMVVPIGTFAEDMQEHLGGEWFDMQDLECFLSERGVHFTASNSASLGQSVDASSLLTSKYITSPFYVDQMLYLLYKFN